MHRRNNPYSRLNQDLGVRALNGHVSASHLSRYTTWAFAVVVMFLSVYTYNQNRTFAATLKESSLQHQHAVSLLKSAHDTEVQKLKTENEDAVKTLKAANLVAIDKLKLELKDKTDQVVSVLLFDKFLTLLDG